MSNPKKAYTYDDINLIPSYSEVESRKNIDLTAQFTKNYKIKIPLIASPMDTVCGVEMAVAMMRLGGVGIIHRFMTIDSQSKSVSIVADIAKKENYDSDTPIAAAIGANGDYLERSQELTKNGANVILIDVAHGHHKFVKIALEKLKQTLPDYVDVIAGNITTHQAAIDLVNWGADALRTGVGNGSLCTTRIKTGFGIPSITAIEDVSEVSTVPIIADGGIRTSGDIAKALAVGASTVMLGSLLAGTKESPGRILETPNGLFKRYRGAASLETKSVHGMEERNVEGESTVIPFKGGISFVIEGLLDGLRSALSYAGASNLGEFNPEYVVVTPAGATEARPHLLK
jgi:IMP dehydrogenase